MSHWSPLDPNFIRDPYPTYRELRRVHPVFWDETLQSWVVSPFKLCEHVLRDHRLFASDFRQLNVETPIQDVSLQTLDPPQHGIISKILSDAMKSTTQDGQVIRDQINKGIQETLANGGADLVATIAIPVGLKLATRLLGLPDDPSRTTEILELLKRIAGSMYSGLDEGKLQPGRDARATLSAWIAAWLEAPAQHGLLWKTLHHPDYATFPDKQLVHNSLRVLFLAAINSTQRMISLALLNLIESRTAAIELAAGNSVADAAKELTRFDGPFQAHSKMALDATTIGDVKVSRGDTVTVLVGAANRDDSVYERPDELIFGRRDANSLAFGRGIHACLGARLALNTLEAVLEGVREHLSQWRLAAEPKYEQNPTIRGLDELVVTYE